MCTKWVCPTSVKELLIGWRGASLRKIQSIIWEAIPATVFWKIWKLRNDCFFNNCMPRWEAQLELIKVKIAQWVKMNFRNDGYSIHDFVHNVDHITSMGIG